MRTSTLPCAISDSRLTFSTLKSQAIANLVSDLRRGETSYAQLLRKYHLHSRTARKHAGRNLLGATGGKLVRASKSDRMVRDLLFPVLSGDVPSAVLV